MTAGPGLGEPAGEQAALAPEMPAVAVAETRVFLLQVEGLRHAGLGQDLERGRRATRRCLPAPVRVDVAADAVEVVSSPRRSSN